MYAFRCPPVGRIRTQLDAMPFDGLNLFHGHGNHPVSCISRQRWCKKLELPRKILMDKKKVHTLPAPLYKLIPLFLNNFSAPSNPDFAACLISNSAFGIARLTIGNSS
jgi:hypothetical protein